MFGIPRRGRGFASHRGERDQWRIRSRDLALARANGDVAGFEVAGFDAATAGVSPGVSPDVSPDGASTASARAGDAATGRERARRSLGNLTIRSRSQPLRSRP